MYIWGFVKQENPIYLTSDSYTYKILGIYDICVTKKSPKMALLKQFLGLHIGVIAGR